MAEDCQNNAPCVFLVLWIEWITPSLCSVQNSVPDTYTVSGSSLLSHSCIYRLQRSRLISQSYSLLCRSVLVSPLLYAVLFPPLQSPWSLWLKGPSKCPIITLRYPEAAHPSQLQQSKRKSQIAHPRRAATKGILKKNFMGGTPFQCLNNQPRQPFFQNNWQGNNQQRNCPQNYSSMDAPPSMNNIPVPMDLK